MSKAVVLFSGGQDSTTCLYAAIERWGVGNVYPLSIRYGQRHLRELESAHHIARMSGCFDRWEAIELPDTVLRSTSPLLSGDPVAQYETANDLPGGLEATFVPVRNLLFLTLAANRAVALGADWVVTGVSQEDFGGYPDCREVFLESAERTIHLALDRKQPIIWAPLVRLTKCMTVQVSEGLPGCREALAYSHTCYCGMQPPCGHCHACLLRERGYEEAGVVDPLLERLGRLPS